MRCVQLFIISLLFVCFELNDRVNCQIPRPQSISLVSFQYPEELFRYDITQDPWLLGSARWAINLPTNGACVVGPDGIGYRVKDLRYGNYATISYRGSTVVGVSETSSQKIWAAAIDVNCNNNPNRAICNDDGLNYMMSLDGAYASWCTSTTEPEYVYAFRLVNRECSIYHYQSNQFVNEKLVIDLEYLPAINALDEDLEQLGIQMYVTHSARVPGQVLSGTVVPPGQMSAHRVAHAVDFNLQCSSCGPEGQSLFCNKECLHQVWLSTPNTSGINQEFRTLLKGGLTIGNRIRYGNTFDDWIHIDDNLYWAKTGDAEQLKTYYHTRLRVQSQLLLVCRSVQCTAPNGFPSISISDVQSSLCQALSQVNIKTSIQNLPNLWRAVLEMLEEIMEEVGETGSSPPSRRLLQTSSGSSNIWDKYNSSGPAYSEVSALRRLTASDLAGGVVNETRAGSEVTVQAQLPDSLIQLLSLTLNMSTLGGRSTNNSMTAFVKYAQLIGLIDVAQAGRLLSNASLQLSLANTWNARFVQHSISSFQPLLDENHEIKNDETIGNERADTIVPLNRSTPTNSFGFSYTVSSVNYTAVVNGTLIVATRTNVSHYAYMPGCYPIQSVRATRVVTALPGSGMVNSIQNITSVSSALTRYSYDLVPDNCLFLSRDASSIISAGGLLLQLNVPWIDGLGRQAAMVHVAFSSSSSVSSTVEYTGLWERIYTSTVLQDVQVSNKEWLNSTLVLDNQVVWPKPAAGSIVVPPYVPCSTPGCEAAKSVDSSINASAGRLRVRWRLITIGLLVIVLF